METEDKHVSLWGWGAIAGSLFALLFVLFIYVFLFRGAPEIILSGLLVIGVIALLVALAFTAVVFKSLKLANPQGVLGLPEGSMRAVIALSLILIFMMSSIFLFYQVQVQSKDKQFIYNDITQEQLNDIPKDQIVSIQRNRNNESLFRVTRLVNQTSNPVAEDIAKQIITTVSTLVVAVAGFYFGTRSVSVAKAAVATPAPLIRRIEPDKGKQNEELKEFTIFGKDLEGTKVVKLVRDSTEMPCLDITSSSTMIRCSLKITGEPGKWSVVVKNSNGAEDTLGGAFEVLITQPDVPASGESKADEQKADQSKTDESKNIKDNQG